MNNTVFALIQRGLDIDKANKLVELKHTLSSLTSMTREQLLKLNIPPDAVSAIHNSTRPPIPEKTVHRLLHATRNICCVCRNRERGILLHHIDPWETSRSHDESNLAVLCTDCHDKAHTRKELTRELSAEQLKAEMKAWREAVVQLDLEAVLHASNWTFMEPVWDYFNRSRLLEVAAGMDIDLGSIPGHTQLSNDEVLGRKGHFRYENNPRMHGGNSEYVFYSSLVQEICFRKKLLALDRIWASRQMKSIASAGSLAGLKGYYRFRNEKPGMEEGPGQVRTGYLVRRGIGVRFVIDGWETTTLSGWTNLRGGWTCTGILLCRSLETTAKALTLNVTCLALGTGLGPSVDSTPAIACHDQDLSEDFGDEGIGQS